MLLHLKLLVHLKVPVQWGTIHKWRRAELGTGCDEERLNNTTIPWCPSVPKSYCWYLSAYLLSLWFIFSSSCCLPFVKVQEYLLPETSKLLLDDDPFFLSSSQACLSQWTQWLFLAWNLLHLLSVFHALLPPSSYTALLLLSKLFFYLLRSSSIGKDTQILRRHSFLSFLRIWPCLLWVVADTVQADWVSSFLPACPSTQQCSLFSTLSHPPPALNCWWSTHCSNAKQRYIYTCSFPHQLCVISSHSATGMQIDICSLNLHAYGCPPPPQKKIHTPKAQQIRERLCKKQCHEFVFPLKNCRQLFLLSSCNNVGALLSL